MRIHSFEHVAEEGLGSIETWAHTFGHQISRTRFYLSEPIPAVEDFEMLVIMGGPMSANDEATLPWLTAELPLIRRAIEQEKTVLGICLGAQLIAKALGSKVFKNSEREIGWYPIQLTAAGWQSRIFGFLPQQLNVFHWHGETFNIPQGAVHLASSEACNNQAFSYGGSERVLGLQFHCEVNPEIIAGIESTSEPEPGKFVQTRQAMLEQSHYCMALNLTMAGILERLTKKHRQ
jgi:GMP synthase-like glutamine amidotransferase